MCVSNAGSIIGTTCDICSDSAIEPIFDLESFKVAPQREGVKLR